MSKLVSIMNPTSPEALKVRLTRRAYLWELLLSILFALPLPLVVLAGGILFVRTPNLGFAIGTIFAAGVIAMPFLFYAALRLNAATLARERAVFGPQAGEIHAPFQGPWFLRRSMVAGSVRSRLVAGLSMSMGFATVGVLMNSLLPGAPFTLILAIIGAVLLVQIYLAVELLLRP